MQEEKQDVKLDSSPNTEEQAVTEVSESAEQTTNVETNSAPQPEELDDRGVPWKNKALEYERKLRETTEKLPSIIQEEIKRANEQSNVKKYSVEELEAFAQENPQHRPWVEAEKFKLLKEQIEQSQNKRFEEQQKVALAARERKEAEDYVVSKYPDVFIKDARGVAVGWNEGHPMTKLISEYMSVPDIRNRPDALKWAAKLAYADHLEQQAPATEKKVKQLKAEVKKVQQKTLTESGTRPASQSIDSRKSAIEQLSRTGSENDARNAVREVLKLSGLIKE